MVCSNNRVRYFFLNVFAVVSFSVSFNSHAALPAVPDLALQQCITDAAILNNWNVVTDVTALDCSNKNITDILGLEQFVALQSLNLANNNITDILMLTPMFDLPANQQVLTYINLQNNRISDISAFDFATQLIQLDISDNKNIGFNDVRSILFNNNGLKNLGLAGVLGFENLLSVNHLIDLQKLNMRNTDIISLDGLIGLYSLQLLDISQNEIVDISALSQFYNGPVQQLNELNLSSNYITDVSALNFATKLTTLDLSDNLNIAQNSVMTVLQNNPSIVNLGLAGVQGFFDLSQLNLLQNLKTLNMRNTGLNNVFGVEQFNELQKLDVSQNNIVDISSLNVLLNVPPQFYKLRQLNLAGNQIIDSSVLNTVTELTMLNLSDNAGITFNDVQLLLQNNKALTHLGLAGVQGFVDLFALSNLTALQELNMQNTGLIYLAGVEVFSRLEVLNISHNNIVGIIPLNGFFNMPAELQTLQQLKLNDNNISDVGVLSAAAQLVVLDISANKNLLFDAVRTLIANNPQLTHLGLGDVQGLNNLFELNSLINLKILNLSNTGLFDLMGIEVFTKLESLDISQNNIVDISALSRFYGGPVQQLNELNLSSNYITDVSALNFATKLTALDLSDNLNIAQNSAMTVLQNNPGIVNLGLAGVQGFFDLSQMNMLQNLKTLNMRNTGLAGILGVEQFSDLQKLDVNQNKITDISSLNALLNVPPELYKLKQLNLANNQITDISVLNTVTGLSLLDLSDNAGLTFADVQLIIQNNKELTHLGLAGVEGFFDLLALSNLTALQELNMQNTGLIYIVGVELLSSLEALNISHNNILDIIPLNGFFNVLAELQTLQQLKLNDNEVSDIGILSGAAQLVVLDISGNTNLSFDAVRPLIANNPQLTHLGLGDVQGADNLFELNSLINLKILNLSNTGLFNLTGIEVFTKLESLDVSQNAIADINYLTQPFNPLNGLQVLKHLNLSDNQITDISTLFSANQLISLDLSDNLNIAQNSVMTILQNNPDIVNLELAGVQGFFDLSQLNMLQNLKTLNMRNTGLIEIFGVERFNKLQKLDVSQNSIVDISSLNVLLNVPLEFYKLRQLNLAGNQIIDLSVLSMVTELTMLDLSDNAGITLNNVQLILQNNKELTHLGLAGAQGFVDLFALSGLTALRELNMRNTGLLSLNGIEQLNGLESLNASANDIVDVRVLNSFFTIPAELQRFQKLDLSANRITDINSLLSAAQLTQLDLSDNLNIGLIEVQSILQNNPQLKQLGLAGVQGFLDLFELRNLTRLQQLNMRNTGLNYLSGIENFINLETLDVSDNALFDLYPMDLLFGAVVGQQKLKYLNFSNNNVFNLLALNQATALKFVDATLNEQISKADVQFLYINNPGVTVLVTDYDLNADGVISGLDYSLFRAMQASNDPLADFDGDGTVTANDYLLLRNAM